MRSGVRRRAAERAVAVDRAVLALACGSFAAAAGAGRSAALG